MRVLGAELALFKRLALRLLPCPLLLGGCEDGDPH